MISKRWCLRLDNAEFLLGTVTAVSTSAGIKIQLDGQDAAMSKYYKILITGAEVPVIGERVAVMKHSGTYVVIGKIGMPSDNTGKVNRSGDTMTGLLNINRSSPGVIGKATARDSSETVAENTNSYGFRINDKNGNLVALYTDRYETTGENGAFIGGYRMVNGTNTGNNLRLLVDAAGNKLVYVTSPAAWRSALNALNKSGDTMTGALTMNGADINLRSTENTIGTVPATSVSDKRVYFRDKLNTIFGKLQSIFLNDGRIGIQFGAQRTVNESLVENNLSLYVDASGSRFVALSVPQAWRGALGLGTNGNLPITAAQGGTGVATAAGHAVFAGPNGSTAAAPSFRALVAADIPALTADHIPNLNASKITAGTLPIARGGSGNSSVVTESTIANVAAAGANVTLTSAYYYQWGKLAMIVVGGNCTAAVSSGSTLFTLVSGKRPVSYSSAQVWMATSYSAVVHSDGQVVLGGNNFSSGTGFTILATYLLS